MVHNLIKFQKLLHVTLKASYYC
uniref:Uncharacterized protein n=1 Tax=Rhizophora mucronata TaxID=61149 RepID=A0A2P2NI81_RHIMU